MTFVTLGDALWCGLLLVSTLGVVLLLFHFDDMD